MGSSHGVVEIDEVVSQFPKVYVLLDQCRFSEGGELTHGRVVLSSPDRDEVYSILRKTPNSVIIYTGPGAQEFEGAFLDRGQTWDHHQAT